MIRKTALAMFSTMLLVPGVNAINFTPCSYEKAQIKRIKQQRKQDRGSKVELSDAEQKAWQEMYDCKRQVRQLERRYASQNEEQDKMVKPVSRH